jgi:hypothetical protein
MLGFRQPRDWRFLDLLRSANQYGLVEGSGATATVALAEIGTDIVSPSSPAQRQAALLRALREVELFGKILDHYRDGRIPENEYFANTLIRDFDVDRERVAAFIRVFTENADFVKAFADVRAKPTKDSKSPA